MSTFLAKSFETIVAYKPGEQLGDDYLKLNANESSQEPSPRVLEVLKNVQNLNYYNDPCQHKLRQKLADLHSLDKTNIIVGTGADDVLDLIFRTFFERGDKLAFPKVTYPFYKGYADTYGYEALEVPLTKDLRVDLSDYEDLPHAVLVVNPDAPTGFLKPLSSIKKLVASHPERLVIVDEAYIDFGGKSAMELVNKYENVLVVQTFSKSRSMAGMRIGYCFGNPELIKALNDVKFSFNSYTMNRTSISYGIESVNDKEYFEECVGKIVKTRENAKERLSQLGFSFPDSKANFIFATHKSVPAKEIFEKLKGKNIFVRYFNQPLIDNYLRITIGTDEQMEKLYAALEEITGQVK